jgi:hypothetical protein
MGYKTSEKGYATFKKQKNYQELFEKMCPSFPHHTYNHIRPHYSKFLEVRVKEWYKCL